MLLNSLGAAKRQEGDLEAALEAYESALAIHEQLVLKVFGRVFIRCLLGFSKVFPGFSLRLPRGFQKSSNIRTQTVLPA